MSDAASMGLESMYDYAKPTPLRIIVAWHFVLLMVWSTSLQRASVNHGDYNADDAPGGSRQHAHGSLNKPGDGDGVISLHHNL